MVYTSIPLPAPVQQWPTMLQAPLQSYDMRPMAAAAVAAAVASASSPLAPADEHVWFSANANMAYSAPQEYGSYSSWHGEVSWSRD